MPTITTRGAATALIYTQKSLGSTNWIGFARQASGETIFNGVTVASSGNVYIAGNAYLRGSITFKLSNLGANVWGNAKTIYLTGCCFPNPAGSNNGIAVDSSENVYPVGWTYFDGGGGGLSWYVAKYNSSGALQNLYGSTSAGQQPAETIQIDSSGNMYIAGQDESSQNLNAYKFSSTFTSTYLRRLKVVGSFSYPSGGYPRGAVDSAGAMYVSGFYDQSSCCISIRRAILIKLGTGGTTTSWANSLDFSGGSTRSTYTTNCAVDSAGNVIVVGYSSFGSGIYIIKYTSAGAISWQRKFAGASEANSVAVDSSNNIYVVASNGYILKYNSSGVLQFQRVLTITQTGYTNAYLNLRSIFISGTNMYICGSTATVPYDGAQACGLVLSLPVDGSKTGTFPVVDTKTVTYSTGTGTDSAQTLTNTSVSITNAAYTPTVGSTSKMYSTLSFTYNKGSV